MPSERKPLLLKDTADVKDKPLSWTNIARGINNFFFDPSSKIHKICEKGDSVKLIEMLEDCPQAELTRLVNTLDDRGNSPLYYAVEKQHLACACLLLKYRADANFRAGKRPYYSLLHTAGLRGNAQMAGLLLYYEADPKKKNSHGKTPFNYKVTLAEALEYKKQYENNDLNQSIEPKKSV